MRKITGQPEKEKTADQVVTIEKTGWSILARGISPGKDWCTYPAAGERTIPLVLTSYQMIYTSNNGSFR
jgi:hypothetical protein